MSPRTISRLLPLLILATLCPPSVVAQVVSGQQIKGDWVRTDSNNDPADLMRITIDGAAVLTAVPRSVQNSWSPGDVLWQNLQTGGSLQVLGSDGAYYPATITMRGPDEISLTIHHSAAGDDQTWHRAGPDISGDWVRVAQGGAGWDGTRIVVQGRDASVRYITGAAPQFLRVGRQLWQGIGASGGLQVLGSDGSFHPATWALLAPDRIQVDASSVAGGQGQIWVRPASVAAARVALQPPPTNPNSPTGQLTPTGSGPPALPSTPSTPPVAAAPPPACLATSMPHDQTGIRWGWGVTSSTGWTTHSETIGVRQHLVNGIPTGTNFGPLEIDRFKASGMQEGFVYVWGQRSRRYPWEEHRDLSSSALDQQNRTAKSAGQRLADLAVYDSGSSTVFAGVWERNLEGVDWQLDHDLTSQQFGQRFQALRGGGYRLVDLEIYQTASGLRYAGLWWASCDSSNWGELRGMTRQTYQDSVNALASRGFRVTDFESYQTGSGQRYAAIWERMPSDRAWAVRTDRTWGRFLNLHNQYTDEGLRLIDFESYDTPNGTRYAGVWGENSPRYDMPFKAEVEDSIQTYKLRHRIPGISVVVMQDDEVIYQRGFGWADSAAVKQAYSGTLYSTASVAKVIGGTLAARLEQQGRIDLRDTTANALDYLDDTHTHTLEQLLAKTGCIRHYDNTLADPDQTKDARGNVRSRPMFFRWREAAIDSMEAPLLPNCTPGQHYSYSTHGFTFVGAALEEELGDDITTIVANELNQPFGLFRLRVGRPNAFSGINGSVGPYDRAMVYQYQPARTSSDEISYEQSSWKVLGGGFETDALELARFGLLTLNGTIVSAATRDNRLWFSLTTGAVNYSNNGTPPDVGLAWVLRNPNLAGMNRRIAEHGGSWAGTRTHLQVYRDDGIIIAIMANQRNGPLTPGPAAPRAHPLGNLADAIGNAVLANPP